MPSRSQYSRAMREQTPVLLCVEEWSHWITVLRNEGSKFVVVDSTDDPQLSVRTWPQLRQWWAYHDTDYNKDDPPVLYDLMAVSPRFRTMVKADFSVERVKFLRYGASVPEPRSDNASALSKCGRSIANG